MGLSLLVRRFGEARVRRMILMATGIAEGIK
jgi:hypothetical protein